MRCNDDLILTVDDTRLCVCVCKGGQGGGSGKRCLFRVIWQFRVSVIKCRCNRRTWKSHYYTHPSLWCVSLVPIRLVLKTDSEILKPPLKRTFLNNARKERQEWVHRPLLLSLLLSLSPYLYQNLFQFFVFSCFEESRLHLCCIGDGKNKGDVHGEESEEERICLSRLKEGSVLSCSVLFCAARTHWQYPHWHLPNMFWVSALFLGCLTAATSYSNMMRHIISDTALSAWYYLT